MLCLCSLLFGFSYACVSVGVVCMVLLVCILFSSVLWFLMLLVGVIKVFMNVCFCVLWSCLFDFVKFAVTLLMLLVDVCVFAYCVLLGIGICMFTCSVDCLVGDRIGLLVFTLSGYFGSAVELIFILMVSLTFSCVVLFGYCFVLLCLGVVFACCLDCVWFFIWLNCFNSNVSYLVLLVFVLLLAW